MYWPHQASIQGNAAAIKTDGSLWIWGANREGQLGNGSTSTPWDQLTPLRVGTDADWKNVLIGVDLHILAIKTNGSLWAWGQQHAGLIRRWHQRHP